MNTGWRTSEFAVVVLVLAIAGGLLWRGDNTGARSLAADCLYAYVGGRSLVKGVHAARGNLPEAS